MTLDKPPLDTATYTWRLEALHAILEVCQSKDDFTAEDVWKTGLTPAHGRALGTVMCHARKLGWCRRTGSFRYERGTSYLKPVWESLLRSAKA